ncbi:hypothetical protein [Bradyrhizobium commune]|uniref:Uncharacterized protein n=1 Tax=Bradyrhizobium commune TaxID=83627 RepID=A0A7S9H010_9BRAD|nr:hypothetical protein [Bradyrhizobium commune]QPF91471.1 hypothetical protein IC761_34385 [Bradyrhizobium commune]
MSIDDVDHLDARAAENAEAVAAIEAALASAGNNPDGWQRLHLAQAISWLWRGAYQAALANAELSLTPAAEHVPVNDPVTDSFTPEALRRALDAVKAEPVRLFPVLGPIVFTG